MTRRSKDAQAPGEAAAARDAILAAARGNAAFEGWGEPALTLAAAEAGVAPDAARLAFPRGAVDLALAFHRAGDAAFAQRLAAEPLDGLRYSEKVARALELRLEVIADEREAVRRAAAFFALPQHAADGARAVWETADAIWRGLDDSSEDVNWYTKRMILSGVWSSVLLYWLGDDSENFTRTRDFIVRRIGDVMRFEKAKAGLRDSALGRAFMAGPGRLLAHVRKPVPPPAGLPGRMSEAGRA